MEVTTGNEGFIFDWAYPPPEEEAAATAFISLLSDNLKKMPCPSVLFAPEESKSPGSSQFVDHTDARKTLTTTDYMKDEDFVPPQIYKRSFIQARSTVEGLATGPEALFGEVK